jgi:hypothetical protein
MKRNFTNDLGFVQKNNVVVSEGITSVSAPSTSVDYSFSKHNVDDKDIKKVIDKACKAYTVDGFVRVAVDRHAEMFKDFELQSQNTEAVKYLEKRLTLISLSTGEHWKTLIARYCHEYFKHGNPMLLKIRGGTQENKLVKRPLYVEKPYAINGLFIVSPTKYEPYLEEGQFFGWTVTGNQKDNTKLVLPASDPLNSNLGLINRTQSPSKNKDKLVLKNGVDILHTPYKKPSNSHYGIGITFPALDDISLLRNIEQTTAIGLKKNTIPILWHRILRSNNPYENPQEEVSKVLASHRRMTQDGLIVTPGTHELKVLGSESQSLRTEGYLKYFATRAFSGLGVSSFLMGFETGTIGTGEAAVELLMNRIRFCQSEISLNIQMFLFNEMLWEGGFDPYTNEQDQVTLIFKEVDEARMIKLRSHFVDVFTKNGIGLDEFRKLSQIPEKVKLSDLYMNRVTIPIAKAEAKAKADYAPEPVAPTTPKTKPLVKKKKVESFFDENFNRNQINSFIEGFVLEFEIYFEGLEETITNLADDPPALLEYLKQLVEE